MGVFTAMRGGKSALDFSKHVQEHFGMYVAERNLNVGCAKNPEPGFVNLDMDRRADADVYHDLECTPLPFDDDTFDCVLGSHVFEHIHHFIPLVADLHRILKPGGILIGVTPYLSSDDAWDSPHHVRAFSENTWRYLTPDLYERTSLPHAGYGAYQGFEYKPWQVVEIRLVPYPEIEVLAQHEAMKGHLNVLDLWKRSQRNVIKEMTAVLRKVEG